MTRADIVRFNSAHLTTVVWTLRLAIGVLFVISGLSKAIDLWGSVYKIEEYFTVWDMMQPRSLVVMMAIGLSSVEFVSGTMLAIGSYKRTSVWLLLMLMCGMLPLTLYIYIADPVSDCGCFGDLWKISNAASFYKNILLTGVLVYLAFFNTKVKGLYHAYTQWITVVLCCIYVLFVGLYGFNVQPLADFRSFPVGTSLVPEDGSEDEDVTFEFIYEKDGETRVFDAGNLPDSTWTFIDRKIVTGDISESTDLVVYDDFGEDVTEDVIASDGCQLLIILPQYNRADVSYTYTVNELQRYIESRGGSIAELAAVPMEHIEQWRDLSMAAYPIYRAESTILKELSRGVMSAVYLVDGRIVWKRSLASLDVDAIVENNEANMLDNIGVSGGKILIVSTLLLAMSLIVVLLVDKSRYVVKWMRKRRDIGKE